MMMAYKDIKLYDEIFGTSVWVAMASALALQEVVLFVNDRFSFQAKKIE